MGKTALRNVELAVYNEIEQKLSSSVLDDIEFFCLFSPFYIEDTLTCIYAQIVNIR